MHRWERGPSRLFFEVVSMLRDLVRRRDDGDKDCGVFVPGWWTRESCRVSAAAAHWYHL
jgi:hypothetical protein